MRFEWTVAVRFLREGGLQTLMIVAGAAAGISVIVFMTSFLGDLQADLIRRTLGVQAARCAKAAPHCRRCRRARSACVRSINGNRCAHGWKKHLAYARCRRLPPGPG